MDTCTSYGYCTCAGRGGERVPRLGQTTYANKLSVARRWREDGWCVGDDGYTWWLLCGPRLGKTINQGFDCLDVACYIVHSTNVGGASKREAQPEREDGLVQRDSLQDQL
jgi:hypothetical protein